MLVLVLSTCRSLLQVELASREQRIPPERPRYDTLQVLDREGHLFWHLRAAPFGDNNSVSTVPS